MAPPKPDLVVTNIAQDPPNPIEGENWQFRVTIKNVGKASMTMPKGTSYLAENSSGSFNAVTLGRSVTLAPGQTYTGTKAPLQSVRALTGTHDVTFKVDPSNVIAEANENNNAKTSSFTIAATAGSPDLRITDFAPTTSSPNTMGFGVRVTLKNEGTAIADVMSGGRTLVSNTNGPAVTIKGGLNLTPGSSITLTGEVINPDPTNAVQWTLKADPDNHVQESNESNNTKTKTLSVGTAASKPDLVISKIDRIGTDPRKGEYRRFEIHIKNTGAGPAWIPSSLTCVRENAYGSWQGVTCDRGAVTLAPGQTHVAVKYVRFKDSGTQSVTFEVDPSRVVDETNDGNNSSTKSYNILP